MSDSKQTDHSIPMDRNVGAFDRRAKHYDEGWLGRWHGLIIARSADVALAARPAPCRRIVDIGCGTGAMLQILAQRLPDAEELVGVDPAPAMVVQARAATATDRRIRIEQGVAEQLPLPSCAVDLIVSTTSFDHWADQLAGLKEIDRILAPGGRLVLVDLFAAWLAIGAGRDARRRSRTGRAFRLQLAETTLIVLEFQPVYRLGPLPFITAYVVGRRP